MLRIEFQTPVAGITSKLFELELPIKSLEIDNALPVAGDSVFLFLTVRFDTEVTPEQFAGQLTDIELVEMQPTQVNSHTYYLGLITGFCHASILSLLTKNHAIPHRIVGKHAYLEIIASVRDWNHLKTVASAIENEHGSLELMGTTQTDSIGFPLGSNKIKQSVSGKLSDEQLELLETSYRMGYFRVPQEVTAAEIASELDISRSTLSERLRRVEHNFCELLFGPQE